MLPLPSSNVLKQVVTGTRYLNAYVIMNRNEDDWCHYSGMPSPKAYEKEKLNKCDMCDKLLTEGEHPNCCSDCWCANKEYYE